jgi:hypothetical protein
MCFNQITDTLRSQNQHQHQTETGTGTGGYLDIEDLIFNDNENRDAANAH